MPERVTSLVGKKAKLKIAGENVDLGLCDLCDYFASPLLSANRLNLSVTFGEESC